MPYIPSETDCAIYAEISSHKGLKAREIANALQTDHHVVNHALYHSPLMQELCWQDKNYQWHALILDSSPHAGLSEFSGYYSDVRTFLRLDADTWLEQLKEGCFRISRNLNDTRGLFHSFLDCRQTICNLFRDLEEFSSEDYLDWELVFEFRLKRSRYIRIYADVLIITKKYVFSLEFKMKDQIDSLEVLQAAKYVPYLELIFGKRYEVIPVLVLTRASDLFTQADIPGVEGTVPVCAGDMLFNIFNDYMQFLNG